MSPQQCLGQSPSGGLGQNSCGEAGPGFGVEPQPPWPPFWLRHCLPSVKSSGLNVDKTLPLEVIFGRIALGDPGSNRFGDPGSIYPSKVFSGPGPLGRPPRRLTTRIVPSSSLWYINPSPVIPFGAINFSRGDVLSTGGARRTTGTEDDDRVGVRFGWKLLEIIVAGAGRLAGATAPCWPRGRETNPVLPSPPRC